MLVLRNLEYVGYATSGGKVVHDIEAAEQKFNSVLTEVRALALLCSVILLSWLSWDDAVLNGAWCRAERAGRGVAQLVFFKAAAC